MTLRERQSAVGRLAGAFALASGLAYVAYLFTTGGWCITAWNLLIIPAALYLGWRVAPLGPLVSAASTAAGVTASLLWAFSYESGRLEPWWIGLAGVWWLGLGWLLRRERPRLGLFTLVLSVATLVDFVLTALNAPMPIYALGGFKIPLTMVWTFWVGATLVRDPSLGLGPLSETASARWAGATAMVGGLLWVVFAAGWTFSHGSTQSPRGDTFLGLGALEFTRLLAVPAALLVVSLLGWPLVRRAGLFIALLGAAMIGLGAVLQTSIVNPDRDFAHPLVQAAWLLYVAGLVPVLTVGMLPLGNTWWPSALGKATVIAGLLTPLPVVAFMLSGVSSGGPAWDFALAAMHAAPGVGWIVLGSLLGSAPADRRTG